jgi:putative RNA 2'-phosphotransferase
MKNKIRNISKLMSLILRHDPSVIGIQLDKNGWADVSELMNGINKKGLKLDANLLDLVVKENNKKRFAFNDDKSKIRASQGHSLPVDVELKEMIPPDVLYHGTNEKFLEIIKVEGLKKKSRQHVHLSHETDTAKNVGSRRGQPVILIVDAKRMHSEGSKFYISENGVWLIDNVLPRFISF